MVSWQCVLIRPILRSVQRRKDLTRPIELERADFEALASRLRKRRDVQYEHFEVEGMPAELIRPPQAPEQDLVLNLHAGAFILGSYNTDRVVTARLAHLTGKCVLTPNYRLAPEHPFPAAIEDALKMYRWVLKQGIEPSRVVVTGTSAGGALAVSLLVSARDAGDPPPAAAVCLSPPLDHTISGASVKTNVSSDVTLRPDMLEYAVNTYLGTTDPKTPLASPLFADLHGLPSMLIQAGGGELLLDDAIRFAQHAKEAGVEVELSIWDGMFHGWQALAAFLPEGRKALEEVGRYIRTRLA